MATIKYTSILNSFVSTEGSAGIMTNYIYYSILVVYENGLADIVEGKRDSVRPLLAYLKTPQDELQSLRRDLAELQATVRHMDSSIDSTLNQKVKYVIDSLYPIPDVTNLPEEEGLHLLQQAGLIPLVKNPGNRSLGNNRVIRSISRNSRNFKVVDVISVYQVPDIVGLDMAEAIEKLEHNGLTPNVKYILKQDMPDGIVLSCTRENELNTEVDLEISKTVSLSGAAESGTAGASGIDITGLDDASRRELIDGLQSATNLFSEKAVRRRLDELFRRTSSPVVQFLLDQPDDNIKESSKLVLAELEKQLS